MTSTTTYKRRREKDERDSDSESEVREIAEKYLHSTWPRFLVVEGTDPDKPLSRLSPFAIRKGFEGISKEIKNVKRLRDGSYLVECPSQRICQQILKRDGKIFVDRPVRVSPHRSLNSSRGVVRCRDLCGMSETEIRDELQSQGVTQVKRVTRKDGGKVIPTNTYFVTFCVAKCPEHIDIGYLRVHVDPFVPSPLRCYKCQKFGHTSTRCSGQDTCPKCAQPKHVDVCEKPVECVHCKGDHPAFSKKCPVYEREAQIQKVRSEKGVSFAEAKKLVGVTPPPLQKSYSAAAASPAGGHADPSQGSVVASLQGAVAQLSKMMSTLMVQLEKLVKGGLVTVPTLQKEAAGLTSQDNLTVLSPSQPSLPAGSGPRSGSVGEARPTVPPNPRHSARSSSTSPSHKARSRRAHDKTVSIGDGLKIDAVTAAALSQSKNKKESKNSSRESKASKKAEELGLDNLMDLSTKP